MYDSYWFVVVEEEGDDEDDDDPSVDFFSEADEGEVAPDIIFINFAILFFSFIILFY